MSEARNCLKCIFYSPSTGYCNRYKFYVKDPNNPPCMYISEKPKLITKIEISEFEREIREMLPHVKLISAKAIGIAILLIALHTAYSFLVIKYLFEYPNMSVIEKTLYVEDIWHTFIIYIILNFITLYALLEISFRIARNAQLTIRELNRVIMRIAREIKGSK